MRTKFILIFMLSQIALINPSIISESSIEEVMTYIESQLLPEIKGRTITVYTGKNWEYLLLPSVSKFLFEDINIIENLAPKGQVNRPGDVHEKRYICVHDTGDHSFGAYQWSEAVRNAKIGKTDYLASFQYVVGNDGYYHNIPDNEVAYHAGDGHTEESLFELFPSGVIIDKSKISGNKPQIGINPNGYYTINGIASKIKAPTNSTDNDKILTDEDLNDLGIYTELKEISEGKFEYYIGKTWYNPIFEKISNYGGNFNSIGIESCINYQTDVYFTFQRVAKLVAKLMDENNIGIDEVVQHHYFSGKNCPQTIRTAGLWNFYKSMIMAEYQMLQYQNEGFKFKFRSLNENYVNQFGRVIKRSISLPLKVSYEITVTDKNGQSTSKIFHSTIQPERPLE